MKFAQLYSVLLVIFTSCAFNHDKEPPQPPPVIDGTLTPGFTQVFEAVIGPRCANCHNAADLKAGIDLSTFELVKQHLDEVHRTAVVERSMPKKNPLSDREAAYLEKWIKAGAPERGNDPTKPSEPIPEDELLKPGIKWATIRDKIFEPACIRCHTQPKPDGKLDLEDLSVVRMKATEIFDRTIVIGDMPEDAPPLTPNQKRALSQWIIDGMPE